MNISELQPIEHIEVAQEGRSTALDSDFPFVQISQLAERESWRKEINRPIYHIHKWWATRLGSVFRAITLGALSDRQTDIWREFYRKQNFEGRVVLDPFMGSGTTLGEALKMGCKVIGTDINPVSTFLVRQSLTRVSEGELRAALDRLEREVSLDIIRYYQTRDSETNEIIPVLYYFWVKSVVTPDGEEIPLFDRYVFSQDAYPKKKPKAHMICPNCWKVFEGRYDSVLVRCSYCQTEFNPQIGPVSGQYVTDKNGKRYRIKDLLPTDDRPPAHRMYAMLARRLSGEKIYLPVSSEDEALYKEAERRLEIEHLPLPTMGIRPGYNTDQARGYNYLQWRDFFNSRQLLALGLLLKSILRLEDERIRDQMLCLFSSTLEFNNMFCSFKGEGSGAVRHMFSHHILKPERMPLENSVWGTGKNSGTFVSLFESRLVRAKRYLDDPFEISIDTDSAVSGSQKLTVSDPINVSLASSWEEFNQGQRSGLILNGDGQSLPIPSNTVDAVITDPPYFDFVHYSELSDFFFAWLAPALKDRYPFFNTQDSSRLGEVQHKDPRIFAHQLRNVFSECRRVLKDDGILVFSFHHSRPDGWAAIYDAITKAGLVIVTAYPVHAELRAASPKSGTKEPINLDAILVCRKRVTQQSPTTRNLHVSTILDGAKRVWQELEQAGMQISVTDQFVIATAHLLVSLSGASLQFEQLEDRLQQLKEILEQASRTTEKR